MNNNFNPFNLQARLVEQKQQTINVKLILTNLFNLFPL